MITELKVGHVYKTLSEMYYTDSDGLEEFDSLYMKDGFTKAFGSYIIPSGTKMVYVGEIGCRGMDLFVIGCGQYEFSWIELDDLVDITH